MKPVLNARNLSMNADRCDVSVRKGRCVIVDGLKNFCNGQISHDSVRTESYTKLIVDDGAADR